MLAIEIVRRFPCGSKGPEQNDGFKRLLFVCHLFQVQFLTGKQFFASRQIFWSVIFQVEIHRVKKLNSEAFLLYAEWEASMKPITY